MKVENKGKIEFTCDFEYWNHETKAMDTCNKPSVWRTNVKQNVLSLHCCEEHACNLKKKHKIEDKDYEIIGVSK